MAVFDAPGRIVWIIVLFDAVIGFWRFAAPTWTDNQLWGGVRPIADGAEFVGINNDHMDWRVTKPATKRAGALAMTTETYPYWPDIVDHGTETLAALAGTMVTGLG